MALLKFCIAFLLPSLYYALPNENITFVIVALQPGVQNPSNFLPTDGKNGAWAWEGVNQLNNHGKVQALKFGHYVRERYGNLLSQEFYLHETLGISGSVQKCQQTLLSLYAGLYPTSPKAQFDFEVPWQPIPLKLEDKALGISKMECTDYENMIQKHLNGSDLWSGNTNLTNLVIYLAKNAGVKPTVQGLMDVLYNWRAMKSIHFQPPTYLEHPTLSGFTSAEDIYSTLLSIENDTLSTCSNDVTCRLTASGYWMHQALNVISDKKDGKNDLSMVINVAEPENMISMLKAFGAEALSALPSNGFFLEFRQQPFDAVRLILHNVDDDLSSLKSIPRKLHYQRLPFCNYMEWCPLDVFVEHMRQVENPSPNCNGSMDAKTVVPWVLFGISITIAIALLLVILILLYKADILKIRKTKKYDTSDIKLVS